MKNFQITKEVEYKKTSNIYGAQLEIYVLRPERETQESWAKAAYVSSFFQ